MAYPPASDPAGVGHMSLTILVPDAVVVVAVEPLPAPPVVVVVRVICPPGSLNGGGTMSVVDLSTVEP